MKNSLVLTLVALLIACSDQEQVISKQQLDRGKEIYLDNCAICHGVEGDGIGVALPALGSRPKPILFWELHYDEVLLKSFIESSPDHPIFPNTLEYEAILIHAKNIES